MLAAVIILSILSLVFAYLWTESVHKSKVNAEQLMNLSASVKKLEESNKYWEAEANENLSMYEKELENNKTILSQKKSSETRLGQMAENIVPFLEAFPYDPKNAHFLGQPIDFVVFDYDDGKITFVEVKTGNAKESPRQKLIKNIIKSGRVYYERIRVSPKGVKLKEEKNND